MPSIVYFSPAVALRTFCLVGAIGLLACSESTSPDTVDDVRDEEPTTGSEKDASTKKPDAGKTSPKDASISDPGQIKPRDAGKPQVTPDPTLDSGSGAPVSRPDAGSTPVTTAGGDGGTSVSGIAPEELEMLRQVCVDEINMYRATLMLPPLVRPTPQHELCSDQGAQKDGIAKMAHGSAGSGNPCASAGMRGFPGFQAQNTCPGWPVGARGAAATIADALKGCLKQMWAEGEPAEGTDKCLADYFDGNTECFLAHGHYINMKGSSKKVSCGFYDMGKSTFWMNQDFL
jgi:hypothetical protein